MSAKSNWKLALGMLCLLLLGAGPLLAADVMDTYEWKPICLGAGGWGEGVVCSETDPNVRFMWSDSGQIYRWSAGDQRWLPMIVQNTDGSGFGREIFPEDSQPQNADSNRGVALDPNDNHTLYLYFNTRSGYNITYGSLPYNVYKSTDGGKNFKATKFNEAAKFTLKDDDKFDLLDFRREGLMLSVDPGNSKVVYVGTGTRGVFRTLDGGDNWKTLSGGRLPAPCGQNIINIFPCKKGGTAQINGTPVSKIVYLVFNKGVNAKNEAADGNVYQSTDGGQTWTNITAKGNGPSDRTYNSILDQNTGTLYVLTNGKGKTKRALWKYDGNAWTNIHDTDVGVMAVDPKNPNNLMATAGLGWGISTDAGKTWRNIPRTYICSGKHPQGFSGNPGTAGHNMFGMMTMDMWGTVWMGEGNDGCVKWTFDPNATEIDFIPDTAGIETFNPNDLAFPRNAGGRILVSIQDEYGIIVNNPDTFFLAMFKPQPGLCNGMEISICPNDSDTFTYNGYVASITTDGGKTNTRLPRPADAKKLGFGCLQISRRGDWKAGADHLVFLFPGEGWYSQDSGKTWLKSKTVMGKTIVSTAPWYACHNVVADPFVPDHFYGYFGDGSFWITKDGGITWTKGNSPAEMVFDRTQLIANNLVPNDLWVMTGNGIFHSTDSGASWKAVPGNKGLTTGRNTMVALGKGSGKSGDAPYTVYYVYHSPDASKPAKDCGVYRSTDAGSTWDRIAIHPYGLMLGSGILAASWDTYGLVGVSMFGESYVYGKLKK